MASNTIEILSNREIVERAIAAADRVEADYLACGYTPGRAAHEAAVQYDQTEAALMRERFHILNGEAR
jgi:hypothetical protein